MFYKNNYRSNVANGEMNDRQPSEQCRRFAEILKASPGVVNGVCTATLIRNIKVEILGRPSKSALTLAAMFSFESPDMEGRTLCLGETMILPEEINPFITELRKRQLTITALHNHWLFEMPRIMFIHWESLEPPLDFAKKVAEAFKVLKC
ncbi:MAG: DUF1259 domain-containing protein [Chitinophagales bacterium]